MTTRERLIDEIEATPEAILDEVYHYMVYLKARQQSEAFNGLLLSESALAEEWLNPAEDAAWQDL